MAPDQFPASGEREIAFAGRSNSGKSSAINALARHRALARTSRAPGRTREINFFRLRDGSRVVDLPGYGYAAVPDPVKRSWQRTLTSYVSARTQLIGLVLVVDARHGLRDLDHELLEIYLPSERPVLILASKADKLTASARRAAELGILGKVRSGYPRCERLVTVIVFSAVAPIGVEAADATIASWIT